MKKAYETYKDSGIEWIGNVPSYWELLPVRHYVTLVKGTKPKELTDINTGFPYLTMDYLRGRDGKMTMYPSSIDGLELIEENEILVLWDGANAGEFMLSRKGYLGSTMAKITVNPSKYDKFYFYFLLKTIEKASKDYANGTTIPHFDSKVLTDYYYPCPSLMEQKVISEFLNEKCRKIDSLVAELERQVADLEVLKKSEISHVVTKGLKPEIPLKDSGIEWIGEVPEHWKCLKISWIFNTIGSGTTPKSDDPTMYSDDGFYWLQTGDLNDGYVNNTTKRITEKALSISSLTIYPKGSLVIALYGATIGKLGIMNVDFTTNQACCVLNDSKKMYIKYAFYVLLTSKQAFLLKSGGGGQPNISQDIVRRHIIPCPMLSEQQEIVAYLDTYCEKVDAIAKELHAQIKDLKLYKQSLINEVVTGKIKIID